MKGAGTCSGDSGGPLVCKNEKNELVQEGIVSFGGRYSCDTLPSAYSRVSAYYLWIQKEIQK